MTVQYWTTELVDICHPTVAEMAACQDADRNPLPRHGVFFLVTPLEGVGPPWEPGQRVRVFPAGFTQSVELVLADQPCLDAEVVA